MIIFAIAIGVLLVVDFTTNMLMMVVKMIIFAIATLPPTLPSHCRLNHVDLVSSRDVRCNTRRTRNENDPSGAATPEEQETRTIRVVLQHPNDKKRERSEWRCRIRVVLPVASWIKMRTS
ncbi:hypothetical protein AMTR_s00002p00248890 [Amborella trichopoda]|uniref:Uncharacterized protein n=1 Tax=Amborella trichopoda TaxID=13333 RepID=W1P2U0_AMBTC|nr:hypothetical protein AMTR_s00002p00248890 [Amborella trichopoda]